ncbi:MAG: SIR2 family protein [Candidatus Thiodiazotropha sp. (ex Lucinoma kastoroae)]|nr:SIR2 family protein [Candidatus Thiodiazotropha sp. (ex Lucinoma kastoroae)]MCU7859605.1 SIR2 family protein [Candidatus Thiodiazotropha sp. (ex Lucinoma kastoroae)]
MSFSLSQLFPGIETGLNNIGFLFGAGTSKEAGYPLMPDLTKAVIDNLCATKKRHLKSILDAKGLTYDSAAGEPNIEVLSDLVTEYYVNTHDPKFSDLEDEIRKLIVENILSVEDPDLTHHIRFLEALKQRAHGTPTTVILITTNYDVLFELAAGYVGLRVETGFDGPLRRLFDPAVFDLCRGVVEKTRFSERSELCLNILKLHGSISWLTEAGRVIESGLDLHSASSQRAMILPRRKKVMDTLSEPFDQLFTRTSRMLGSKCKYLVSCGFSFGDKHINDQLLFPKLAEGKIRLVALCGQEPDCVDELKAFPAFHAGFPANCYIDGNETGTGTDLWKFSAFTELLRP